MENRKCIIAVLSSISAYLKFRCRCPVKFGIEACRRSMFLCLDPKRRKLRRKNSSPNWRKWCGQDQETVLLVISWLCCLASASTYLPVFLTHQIARDCLMEKWALILGVKIRVRKRERQSAPKIAPANIELSPLLWKIDFYRCFSFSVKKSVCLFSVHRLFFSLFLYVVPSLHTLTSMTSIDRNVRGTQK